MNCSSCKKEVIADSFFCQWCNVFIPSPEKGKKGNLFARWIALVIDPLIAMVLYFVAMGIGSAISESLGITFAILFPVVYFIWFLTLFRKGLPPGKNCWRFW